RSAFTALALLALSACGSSEPHGHDHPPMAEADGVRIDHGWVRAAPSGRTMTAAYFDLASTDGSDDVLIAVSGVVARTYELHETTSENDVMTMRQVSEIPVTAEGVSLEPGGLHVMLIDLNGSLLDGDDVALNLTFRDAGTIEIIAPVKGEGDDHEHDHDHDH
ncbi:MAG: copper chaperone PCu(A)C, partial [Pseudomonadota bacterium]